MQTISRKYRLVKCPSCEGNVDRNTEPFVEHSKRYYHEKCFQLFELQKQHREELISYICQLYEIDMPNIYMRKQIKDFQDEYNYTLKGMELALRYFHEIEGNPVDAKGIGIVPYIYEDAKRYYVRMQRINQANSNQKLDNEIEVIYASPHKKRGRKTISIEDIQ